MHDDDGECWYDIDVGDGDVGHSRLTLDAG